VGPFLGARRKLDGSIFLAPRRMEWSAPGCAAKVGDCVEAVTLHEVGHVLGLGHSPLPSVMAADGPLLLEFTETDRGACVAAGVCDAAALGSY